jgi:hypothetical protein
LNFALGLGVCLFVICFVLFVINIRISRTSDFYRNLLVRLLIFSVIILRLHPDLPF